MTDRFDEMDAYKQDCKSKRDGPFLEYSSYVHGYLIPFLNYMREEGIVRKGKHLKCRDIDLSSKGRRYHKRRIL